MRQSMQGFGSEMPAKSISQHLVAVVAASRNGVIGRNGAMPWSLPSDLARYRRLTMNKPMIMGRRTLESIGRVLDGRDTIVLTRASELPFEGAILARSPREALALASEAARARGSDEIVIAGGGEVYALFWDRIDRIELTRVELDVEGDAHLPAIDPRCFRLVSEGAAPRGAEDGADARHLVYARVPDG
jgi:dihydrofolate reductase